MHIRILNELFSVLIYQESSADCFPIENNIFYFETNFKCFPMKELIYPKKLDVPCTQGNIYDLLDFFCGKRHTRSIARIEMERCKHLSYN